jgi:RNA-directed DNA polymerase
MEESHGKGLASHPDPESCAATGNGGREVLTGARTGQVLSCEIIHTGMPTSLSEAEGNTGPDAMASPARVPRSRRP